MATKTKNDNVVKSTDLAEAFQGNYFSTLDLPTLHTVADYFGAEQQESIEEQVAALADMGVTYKLYAQAFKIPLPDGYTEEPVVVEEEPVNTLSEPVVVEEHPALQPQKEYLIKMTRKNPYFEVGKYKWRAARRCR